MEHINCLVVGAGIAGLSFSHCYPDQSILIEKENFVGGNARSYSIDGHTFDIGGHYLHGDHALLNSLGIDLTKFTEHERKAQVLLSGKLYPYPIQNSHYIADPNVLPLDGVNTGSLREYFVNSFGALAWDFFIPYNEKVFRCSTNEMVPFHYTSLRNPKGKGYNSNFLYSNTGIGSQELVNQLTSGKEIRLHHKLVAIDKTSKIAIVDIDGKLVKYTYNKLIYTGSLSLLDHLLGDPALKASIECKGVNMFVINVVVGSIESQFKDSHWIYLPDLEIPFFRIGFYNRVNPSDDSSERLYLEFSFSGDFSEAIITNEKIEYYLSKIGVIKAGSNSVISFSVIPVNNAYPIITQENFSKQLEEIIGQLEQYQIYLTGRYALWKWSGMAETMGDAKELAERLS